MKKGLAILMVLFSLIAVADGIQAQCRTVGRVQQAYVAPVQYQQHNYVAPVVAAVYQAIPVYSVGYAPDNKEELQLLRIQLFQFQQQFLTFQQQQLQQSGNPAPIAPQVPGIKPPLQQLPSPQKVGTANHPAIGVFQKACSNCHSDATKAKGGGFVMFQGDAPVAFSDKQAFSIVREIFAGRMPKNAKLADDDIDKISDWADTIKVK